MNSKKTPLEMFYQWEREAPNEIYLRQAHAGTWTEYTWSQVADQVRRVASFIQSKNYPSKSSIAIWARNSKDWFVVDLAIMLTGNISIPLYAGQDMDSAQYILEHCDAKMIFLGGIDQFTKVDETLPKNIARVAMLDCQIPADENIEHILQTFEPMKESPVPHTEDIFTILYTSGTTGKPKGVMHAHGTPSEVCPDLMQALRMEPGNTKYFSFLPLAHAAERILVEMASLYAKGVVSFSAGLETFAEELRSVQPQFFFAVPRLWAKFKEAIDSKIPPEHQKQLTQEQKMGIVRQLGLSEARFILTGAAPCPKEIQQWYLNMGIILREGYGMTENFIHGLCWLHDDNPVPGSVGREMTKGVEVRISDSGEILFRSKGLMKGYYKEPEKTRDAFEDGWYRSGDAGYRDENGNYWLTGRVSEVFKTGYGKFVQPIKIEGLLASSYLVSQVCATGHGMNQPLALLTLSQIGLSMKEEEIASHLEKLIESTNAQLSKWEQISKVIVFRDDWSIEAGLLTPTMKMKRLSIHKRFGDLVERYKDVDQVVIFATS
jgi:long-chain acyl-CoA synthetase